MPLGLRLQTLRCKSSGHTKDGSRLPPVLGASSAVSAAQPVAGAQRRRYYGKQQESTPQALSVLEGRGLCQVLREAA